MTQPTGLLKLALWSLASWACSVVLGFLFIAVTAASVERAQTSTASAAAVMLIVAQFLVACGSVAFVFFRSRRYIENATRYLWVAAFALVQLATCALAGLVSLLALNR